VELPEGWNPDEYVQAVNDARRQETPDQIADRMKERRKRIAARRAEGASTRQIAEEEEISQSTVQRDLEEEGVTVAEVTGTDGRRQRGKKACESHDSVKVCDRCVRTGKVRNCPQCKELNKPKTRKKGGRPLYSWALFKGGIGTTIREITKLCKLYNVDRDSPKPAALMRQADQFEKDVKAWYASDLTCQSSPKG
jgi:hypothetical protein